MGPAVGRCGQEGGVRGMKADDEDFGGFEHE